jgi:hypothetical protein
MILHLNSGARIGHKKKLKNKRDENGYLWDECDVV